MDREHEMVPCFLFNNQQLSSRCVFLKLRCAILLQQAILPMVPKNSHLLPAGVFVQLASHLETNYAINPGLYQKKREPLNLHG